MQERTVFRGLRHHGDFSMLGEFHRVAHQIQEDLLDPAPVAVHPARFGGYSRDQRQPFFVGERLHALNDLLNRIRHIEWRVLDLDLTGLDLGNVEDVVDQGEEMFTAAFHHLKLLGLLLVRVV